MAAADGADTASDICVGDRVRDKSGNRATVRYVGPVATSKSADAVYVGVEWDAEGRGKNDGSVVTDAGETVRYFECEPGMGSFLKAKLVDRGVSLISALEEKYGDSTQGGGQVIAESGEAVEVILVGEDEARRRQQLHRLWNVALLSKGVSRIDAGTVASAAPSLAELDLSANLLCRWTDIASLGAGAPKLRTLNLSGNAMAHPTPADASSLASAPLAGLGVLVLSGCGVTVADFLALRPAAAFPALTELHLANNCIRRIEAPPAAQAGGAEADTAGPAKSDHETAAELAAALPRLETLNLSGNALASWSDVWRLCRLPSLRRLIVAGNALTEAAYGPTLAAAWPLPAELPHEKAPAFARRAALKLFPHAAVAPAAGSAPAAAAAAGAGADAAGAASEAEAAAAASAAALPFASLTSLTLSDNPLSSWDSVTALAAFPALSALRVAGAGVVGELGSNRARLEVVARLATVRTLNGSEVRPREREDAEKAYVRRVCHETASAAETPTFAEAVGATAEQLEELVTDVVATLATGTIGSAKGDEAGSAACSAGAGSGVASAAAAAAVAAAHPRLFPLMLRHGEVAAAARDTGPKTMGSSTVSVTIRSMAGASSAMDPVTKRLPGSMTVLTLKQLAARAFKGDVAMCRLSFRDGKDAYPTPLDDDSKPITYFGVCDGCEILLEEVDSAELVREAAEQEAAQAELMRREEERAAAMRRLKMDELRRNRSALAAAAAAAQAP